MHNEFFFTLKHFIISHEIYMCFILTHYNENIFQIFVCWPSWFHCHLCCVKQAESYIRRLFTPNLLTLQIGVREYTWATAIDLELMFLCYSQCKIKGKYSTFKIFQNIRDKLQTSKKGQITYCNDGVISLLYNITQIHI